MIPILCPHRYDSYSVGICLIFATSMMEKGEEFNQPVWSVGNSGLEGNF